MKIRKLHIKNYKIFNDLELDFTDANGETLDKVVLAGVNGCGKTTILEIFTKIYDLSIFNYFENDKRNGFISIEAEITSEDKRLCQKAISKSRNNVDSPFDVNISDFLTKIINEDNYITLRFDASNEYKSAIVFFNILGAKRPQGDEQKLIYFPVGDIKPSSGKSMLGLEILSLRFEKNTMKHLALKDIRNEIFKNEDIAPRKSKEKAIKRITKALNGLKLTTKLVDLDSEELIFESANGQRIKFEELSNGEQTLYFRAIYLSTLNPQNSIIMIDEPEESLHPTWQQKVLKLYQNIGENNQVIVATHSPHIIGSSNAEEVFLLEIDEQEIEARHPKYTKGHSIDYILEVMGANPRDTNVINMIDDYLALVRKGMHETEMGLKLKAEINALNLDPNSAEMRRIDLSLKRFNAVGV